jgi:hypothetical protein
MLLRKSSSNARLNVGLHLAGLVLTAVFLVVGSGTGCYNPSITDGGFVCADAGKRCPDGFECSATDNHCHATVKCSVTVAPLCQDTPKAGTACNPACQTGCACGRCNVAGKLAVCSTQIGTATLGQICNPSKDNCAAGLICLLEADTCGANLGRCYQHCTATGATAAQCGSGRSCEIPILDGSNADTGYKACSLMTQTCSPLATAAASNGCPAATLGCYLATGGATFCDCPNRTAPGILGASCDVYNDCAAGLMCTASTGSVGNHCRTICMVQGQNTCPGGGRCNAVGTVYGYCN